MVNQDLTLLTVLMMVLVQNQEKLWVVQVHRQVVDLVKVLGVTVLLVAVVVHAVLQRARVVRHHVPPPRRRPGPRRRVHLAGRGRGRGARKKKKTPFVCGKS